MVVDSFFSVYSVFIYVNTENVALAFSTSVYFLSTSFLLETLNYVSFMAVYGLLSNTYVDNMSFYATNMTEVWSLFYIWNGNFYIKDTILRYYAIK